MTAAVGKAAVLAQIHDLARPLRTDRDFNPLVRRAAESRFVAIGEATHGTHEFHTWRNTLSRRLVQEEGYNWIGVEGDWPDCWRINRWVRGQSGPEQGVHALLAGFERWPAWMWANEEMAGFLDWLRGWNLSRPEDRRVGFYGLDVYSLWDSLREIIGWLEQNDPDAGPAAARAWQIFLAHHENLHEYAAGARLVPESREADVVALLAEVRNRVFAPGGHGEDAFDAVQNAEVAANAERYYRIMVRGDRQSWNIREHHMADTVDRLSRHLGGASKGIIWAHNTHVGDARGTGMAQEGLVNLGQLLRERHAKEGVLLVGFASHRGELTAAKAWGSPAQLLTVPPARPGSHEDLLHEALGVPSVLDFGQDRSGPWLSGWLGHRAIGVVYKPETELRNYVPSRMGERYDALVWLEHTAALRPVHPERPHRDSEFETEPTGF